MCAGTLEDLVSHVNETLSARHHAAFPTMVTTKDGRSADAVVASQDIAVTVKTTVLYTGS